MIVLASEISPDSIFRSTSARGSATTSMNSSASGLDSPRVRPVAMKRWIFSFVNPGVVHIAVSGVTEAAVRQVLAVRGVDEKGTEGTRLKYGQTAAGRYLKVIYRAREDEPELLVITAYELGGKTRKAFRRRQRRKGK